MGRLLRHCTTHYWDSILTTPRSRGDIPILISKFSDRLPSRLESPLDARKLYSVYSEAFLLQVQLNQNPSNSKRCFSFLIWALIASSLRSSLTVKKSQNEASSSTKAKVKKTRFLSPSPAQMTEGAYAVLGMLESSECFIRDRKSTRLNSSH